MYLAPPWAATAKKTEVSMREVNCCTAWIRIFTTPTEGTVEEDESPAIIDDDVDDDDVTDGIFFSSSFFFYSYAH